MYWLGIDLGGTNIVAGVVDENYKIIGKGAVKTNAPRPAEAIADDMALAVKLALKNANVDMKDIVSVGIGSPGAIDTDNGTVVFSGNLDFANVPLCSMLKERLGVDLYIENDANAATYGEFIAGAGKGTNNFIAVTLGTGVGGGIIIDGKVYSGFNFAAGELGHNVIVVDGEPCTCGRKGCWEAYASATALIRQTKASMKQNPDSVMWQIANGNIDAANGLTAFDAMRKGDAAGKQVVDRYLSYLACGVINLLNMFEPDMLCIGGGVSNEGDTLLNPIFEAMKNEYFMRSSTHQSVVKVAQLGNDAGIIGAAFLCRLHQ